MEHVGCDGDKRIWVSLSSDFTCPATARTRSVIAGWSFYLCPSIPSKFISRVHVDKLTRDQVVCLYALNGFVNGLVPDRFLRGFGFFLGMVK
jgi:hypothetical protein